jgi:hypothetical protein
MRGLARGTWDLAVGRLLTDGASVGGYWTHFGPTGWYVDTVLQQNWYDTEATSLYGSTLSTQMTGYTASFETGYPINLRENWLIEPQAQIVYQDVRVDGRRTSIRVWTGMRGRPGPGGSGRVCNTPGATPAGPFGNLIDGSISGTPSPARTACSSGNLPPPLRTGLATQRWKSAAV